VTATATGTPFCGDAYEPDNVPAQAHPLDLGTEQTHSICPAADEDWFSIAVVSNKVYTLYTKDLGGGLDTILAVYNADGTKIGENDDAPGCLCSRIDMSFPAGGTYFVRVRDNRRLGGLGWIYTVGFAAMPGPAPSVTPTFTPTVNPLALTATPGSCSDPYEPDGEPAAAHLLLIGEIQPGHNFCPAGDADWYRFFGGRGKAYTIQTFNLGIGVDTYLYLFDSDGTTVLAQNDDAPSPPTSNPNDVVASALEFFPVRDDFYYIMVKNKGDLGSPAMVYTVSLKVRANVPPPAGTAAPIIAPVVTVVTTAVPPTLPASLPTPPPTSAPASPTPTDARPTPAPPSPLPTGGPAPQQPPAPTAAAPTGPPPTTTVPSVPVPTAIPAPIAVPTATPPPAVANPPPGVLPLGEPLVPLPATGHAPDGPAAIAMPLQVYVDRNGNGHLDAGESAYGLPMIFASAGNRIGSRTTRSGGARSPLLPPGAQISVTIPYLQWSGTVTANANGLWVRLPAAALPARIP